MRSELNTLRQEESSYEQKIEAAKLQLEAVMKSCKESQQSISQVGCCENPLLSHTYSSPGFSG